MSRVILLGLLLAFGANEAFAQSKNVQNAIDVIVMFCVAGGTSEVSVTGTDGGLELKKEGGAGITISKSEAKGLVAGIEHEMTKNSAGQASEARKCMQPYIDRIIDTLLDKVPPSPRPTPIVRPDTLLLQKISESRWCTQNRRYILQLGGNSIVWTDDRGDTDTERVVYNNVVEAQTVTQGSNHTHGGGEPAGTSWTYSPSGTDRIEVQKNGAKAFSLKRC